MDLNDLRSLATLMMFVLFVGIVAWAYSRKRSGEFADAEQLPLMGELRAEAAAQPPSGD